MIIHTQRVEGPIYAHVAKGLGIGIAMLERTGMFRPLLLIWDHDGNCRGIDITDCSPERAVAGAERLVRNLAETVTAYAIVFDGTASIDSGKPWDAIIARVAVAEGEEALIAMQRYRTNDSGDYLEPQGNISIVGHAENLLKAS